jgi:hypothetical protein
MTTRTVKIFGLAYGATPAEIAVTLDGVSVYTGTVPTTDTLPPALPNLEISNTTVEFCNFEIPMEFEGTKPMICSVTNGTVVFAQIKANYGVVANTAPAYGVGADVFIPTAGPTNTRLNVVIDGVAATITNSEELPGIVWLTIPAGSTLAYDLNINAGTANIVPVAP